MSKKVLFSLFIVFSLLLVSQMSFAQGLKIGYVDIQKVIFTSQRGKSAIAKVKAFQERRQQTISDMEKDLNKMEQDLSKQLFSITDEAKAVKQEDIRKKKLELKRLLEDSEYELDRKKKEVLAVINKNVVTLIRKLGKQESYSLILEVTGSNIIHGDPSLDLTDRVIAEFDKAAK